MPDQTAAAISQPQTGSDHFPNSSDCDVDRDVCPRRTSSAGDSSQHKFDGSYADKLSSKFSRDFRRIIEHPDYKRLFPDLKTGRKATETEFETTLNGGRFATSVGATMVGMGANLLVVDDPITPEEVASETRRENVNEWFFSTAHPRLNDKRRDAVVIVTHRVHEDDLIGRLTEDDDHDWKVVSLAGKA